jgi:tetratricopeptide (TPR) repeat protein
MKPIISLLCTCFCVINLCAQDSKLLMRLSYGEIDSLIYIEYGKGDYKKALGLIKIARKKVQIEFGEQDSIFNLYTNNLGFCYRMIGEYEKALFLFIQVRDYTKKNIRGRTSLLWGFSW